MVPIIIFLQNVDDKIRIGDNDSILDGFFAANLTYWLNNAIILFAAYLNYSNSQKEFIQKYLTKTNRKFYNVILTSLCTISVINQLKLNDIKAIHGRAEDFAKQKDYRENYDLCVSRAVANLATLSEYCIPYVKVGGHFISYKSGNIEQEVSDSENAIRILGGEIQKIEKFNLPETDIERSVVIIAKKSSTAKKYPRKSGIPSKEPLK